MPCSHYPSYARFAMTRWRGWARRTAAACCSRRWAPISRRTAAPPTRRNAFTSTATRCSIGSAGSRTCSGWTCAMPKCGLRCTWRSRSATSSTSSPTLTLPRKAGREIWMLPRMRPDDVGDLRGCWLRTDKGSRSSAERREDGGRDRRVSLVAGMEPVGTAQKARPTIAGVEVIDAVEPNEADERPAVPQTRLLNDGVAASGWQPAADAQHAGLRTAHGADDGLVLRRKHVRGCVETDVVGAQLDRHQGRVGGGDPTQLRDRPGGLRAAVGHQVEVHPQLFANQRRKCPVLGGREAAGADTVAEGDVYLPLQALIVGTCVHADHLTRCHRGTLGGRLPDGENQ